MSPITTVNLLATLFVIFCAFVASLIAEEYDLSALHGVMVGSSFGLILVLIDRLLRGFSLRAFSSATFGLFLGLIFATLLRASDVLRYLPEREEWVISLSIYAAFAYLGMMLAMRSNRDEFSLIIPYVRFTRQAVQDAPLVLDTNIIIDGRIIDLCESGFLSGQLVIPNFVLEELQNLADSADDVRRVRGRRGLETINRLKASPNINLNFHEHDRIESKSVDQMLIHVTQFLQARLLTNDSDLCQVARLSRVAALNLNDLLRAVRANIHPGDEVELDLVKEGRDPSQAVGYLTDGTMIVVNHGGPLIGERVTVVVGSALQTSAGRLFFAELKH